MDLKDKKVLVFGSGISGIGAADLLGSAGAHPIIFDGNEKLSKEDILHKTRGDYPVEIYVGELPESVQKSLDLVVLSPGVPTDIPQVLSFFRQGIPVWGEVELAYQMGKGMVMAVTGTNGKTTTTALTGEIMRHFFNSVFVVGNIGDPYTAHARETTEESVTVAEVSSFQLETIMEFHPNVSAITNITPDHLDRHKTMDCYIQVKEGIARNQTEEDSCVLNYDDPELRAFGSTLKSKVIYFSRREKLDQGVYMDGDRIVYRHGGKTEPVLDVKDLQIIGGHNHENVMTAVAISLQMGVPIPVIREACMAFKAVEHRIEFVRERFGVTYYNDSKGTNPDAAIQAIRAMPGPTLLIAGGYDKHSEYDEWIESFDGKVRYLVSSARPGIRSPSAQRNMGSRISCTQRICRRPSRSAPPTPMPAIMCCFLRPVQAGECLKIMKSGGGSLRNA